MLDPNLLKTNPELIQKTLKKRNLNLDLNKIKKIDQKRRQLIKAVDDLRAERNRLKTLSLTEAKKKGAKIKERLKKLEIQLKNHNEKFLNLWIKVPNLVLKTVPDGKDESQNAVIKTWGQQPKFKFKPLDHAEIGKNLDILDFKTGAKVSGSNFVFLKNEGVLLELALIKFGLDFLIKEEGFIPWITPDLAKSRYYLGTGFQPKGPEPQIYTISDCDLGLIATAEITMAGIHADQILKEKNLPKKYAGYSHCFRVESGGYGKYSKGLYRMHQFTKLEMFIYCTPEDSEKMHEYLLSLEEKIYQKLNIPYRVVEMCAGDLGNQAARKFDLEAWMPGRDDYGEITSTSNCLDYQARRLKVRIKRKNGKIEYAHMLNGTAIATSRVIIAILENYQKKDGSIHIPKALIPYLKQKVIVKKT